MQLRFSAHLHQPSSGTRIPMWHHVEKWIVETMNDFFNDVDDGLQSKEYSWLSARLLYFRQSLGRLEYNSRRQMTSEFTVATLCKNDPHPLAVSLHRRLYTIANSSTAGRNRDPRILHISRSQSTTTDRSEWAGSIHRITLPPPIHNRHQVLLAIALVAHFFNREWCSCFIPKYGWNESCLEPGQNI